MGLTQRKIGPTRTSANTKGFGSRPALLVREINSAEEKDLLERKRGRRVMQRKLAHSFELAVVSHTMTGKHSAPLSTGSNQISPRFFITKVMCMR